jgi:hypothetical protein
MRAFHEPESTRTTTLDGSQIEQSLLRAAQDEDPLIRSEATFALGRVGTPAAVSRLQALVGDPHADTRYNAAVALAHRGDAAGVGVLAEMLEPLPLASAKEESDEATQVRKRTTILQNAMEAARALRASNASANLAPVVTALHELAEADDKSLKDALIPSGANAAAKKTLEAITSQ